ncbi:MAG TPA: hypothetical protein VIH93_02420 [Thermoanaerobaculia bacterium]
MRKALLLISLLATVALPAAAHVTPNVELVKKGDFIQQSLPGATRFLEQKLSLGDADLASVRHATGWTPSEEDAKIYVGRDASGGRAGTVVLLWMPSQHGPVGVAVAFGPEGKIARATVTDVGSEPLAWIRPLLQADGMSAFAGLPLDAAPDAAKIAPGVAGTMSRYYAKVIAQAVARAQALERVSMAAAK